MTFISRFVRREMRKKIFNYLMRKSLIKSRWFYSWFPANLLQAVMFTNIENSHTLSPILYPKSVSLSLGWLGSFCKVNMLKTFRQEESHQAEPMQRNLQMKWGWLGSAVFQGVPKGLGEDSKPWGRPEEKEKTCFHITLFWWAQVWGWAGGSPKPL